MMNGEGGWVGGEICRVKSMSMALVGYCILSYPILLLSFLLVYPLFILVYGVFFLRAALDWTGLD